MHDMTFFFFFFYRKHFISKLKGQQTVLHQTDSELTKLIQIATSYKGREQKKEFNSPLNISSIMPKFQRQT